MSAEKKEKNKPQRTKSENDDRIIFYWNVFLLNVLIICRVTKRQNKK